MSEDIEAHIRPSQPHPAPKEVGSKDDSFAKTVWKWWDVMQPDPEKGKRGDRAALARLRRCSTILDAMMEPSTQNLARLCHIRNEEDLPRIALVAAILGGVREDNKRYAHVARQVGPTNGAEALYKPLRFRRLLEAGSPDECLKGFRRLMALAGKSVNVRDLAKSVYEWPTEDATPRQMEAAEKRRVSWVYHYWDAGDSPNSKDENSISDSL